eukprot:5505374-Prorocentrum_lima.AAC.1
MLDPDPRRPPLVLPRLLSPRGWEYNRAGAGQTGMSNQPGGTNPFLQDLYHPVKACQAMEGHQDKKF